MPNYVTPYSMGYPTQTPTGQGFNYSQIPKAQAPGPAATGNTLPGYNTTPAPTGGQGPYGAVPGVIGLPPSPWQQATSAIPALANTGQLTNNIMSELQGDINPQALKNMQDAAAAYGISSGMPGSNAIPGTLAFNKNLRNIGLDTQAVQHQGAQDYSSLLGSVAGLQTPQSLAAEIAAHNAQLKAAPDPAKAAQQQLANYLAALNATRGPGGGTGGGGRPSAGTGAFAPPPAFNPADYGFGFGSLGGQGRGYTAPIAGGGAGFSPDSMYPGTEIPGLSNLGSILGPQSPAGSFDASNPNSWDFTNIGYDQSASPDFTGYDQAFSNPEDYYGGF